MNLYSRAFLGSVSFLVFSCAKENLETKTVESLQPVLGCSDFDNKFFNSMDHFLTSEGRPPNLKGLDDKISQLVNSGEISAEAGDAWKNIYKILLEAAPEKERLDNVVDYRSLFAALEIGDETTPARKELKEKLQVEFSRMSAMSNPCNPETPEGTPTPSPAVTPGPVPTVVPSGDAFERQVGQLTKPRAYLGMRWSFATAYQTCSAVRKPAMTVSTPNVQGISIIGTHPDGVGFKRKISNVDQLLNSHYYYKGETPAPQCHNFLQSPLIYDYGGKPNPVNSTTLDFFSNAGSGQTVLGTDCSGLVFSAIATAGLRVKSSKTLEARNVLGLSSSMFLEPDKNGLTCFDYVSMNKNQTIFPGDIAAVNGHVLMVGETGVDPLGISKITNRNSCSNITAEDFNFEVWQSSPDKDGIGINRFKASDYVKWGSSKMRNGFVAYAIEACKAKFDGTTVKPRPSTFSLIRHKGTSDCRATRITLAKESCIQECTGLFE
jgi:hypothetical protein